MNNFKTNFSEVEAFSQFYISGRRIYNCLALLDRLARRDIRPGRRGAESDHQRPRHV
ncbi:hypothetical protein Fmac_009024 [Flemingia macrophylla]|uniref:Ribosomal protein S14 n=1 Tax=Flemingia macrophylla TaxID=520843 RepID=A0ABD1MZ51_9FABA